MLKQLKDFLCVWLTGLTVTEVEVVYQSRKALKELNNVD